jgi:hypothetical protein
MRIRTNKKIEHQNNIEKTNQKKKKKKSNNKYELITILYNNN